MKIVYSFTNKIFANQFLAGSLIMLVGSNIHNFAQLVFHFLAGRMLGVEYYGDVAALINILGILAIVQMSLGLTIVKFISSTDNEKEVANFCKWINYFSLWIGGILCLIFLLLGPFLAKFLNIHQVESVYWIGPLAFLFMSANIGRSILQGLLKFNSLVLSMISEVTVKTILAVLFIAGGAATHGVLGAMFIGVLLSILIIYVNLKEYLIGKSGKMPDMKPFIKYSFPVFIQGVSLTSMYSTDLLLVKHFFTSTEAGIYAALAKLGSIVFFGVTPIASVMFPLVSKKMAKSEPYKNIFFMSLVFVVFVAGLIVILYKFIPELILSLLWGNEYLAGANLLWWFGAFMGLLAVSNLITQFYLSVGETRAVWIFACSSVLQGLLIWFNHDSLLRVVQISLVSAALLVLTLFVYFFNFQRKK